MVLLVLRRQGLQRYAFEILYIGTSSTAMKAAEMLTAATRLLDSRFVIGGFSLTGV